MIPRFVVTGTDTGIGKTVFSAALTDALGAHYWKPVQSGNLEASEYSFQNKQNPIRHLVR